MIELSGTDKKKLFSLFKDIKSGKNESLERHLNSDVLLIDGNNTYLRCYSANPTLNSDGEHVGGIIGFMQSIGYAIRMVRPTRCVIVFDGKGGSLKRRAIYKDYKSKRRSKIRLNRVYEDTTSPDIEEKSILEQMQKVVALCQRLPVTLMAIDNIEADDTIAYLSTELFNNSKTNSVTIMSADKDFFQLVNDKVRIWSPTKKKMYGPKEIFDETGISSRNYIFYKILNGDSSDNVDGIKGIGPATAKKALPMITEEKQYSFDDIINYIKDNKNSKIKAHQSMNENLDTIKRNFSLMQLKTSDISNISKMSIQECLHKKLTIVNPYEFTVLLKKYKVLGVFKNHHVWLKETFSDLDYYSKNV